jgi:hypothetical protein
MQCESATSASESGTSTAESTSKAQQLHQQLKLFNSSISSAETSPDTKSLPGTCHFWVSVGSFPFLNLYLSSHPSSILLSSKTNSIGIGWCLPCITTATIVQNPNSTPSRLAKVGPITAAISTNDRNETGKPATTTAVPVRKVVQSKSSSNLAFPTSTAAAAAAAVTSIDKNISLVRRSYSTRLNPRPRRRRRSSSASLASASSSDSASTARTQLSASTAVAAMSSSTTTSRPCLRHAYSRSYDDLLSRVNRVSHQQQSYFPCHTTKSVKFFLPESSQASSMTNTNHLLFPATSTDGGSGTLVPDYRNTAATAAAAAFATAFYYPCYQPPYCYLTSAAAAFYQQHPGTFAMSSYEYKTGTTEMFQPLFWLWPFLDRSGGHQNFWRDRRSRRRRSADLLHVFAQSRLNFRGKTFFKGLMFTFSSQPILNDPFF